MKNNLYNSKRMHLQVTPLLVPQTVYRMVDARYDRGIPFFGCKNGCGITGILDKKILSSEKKNNRHFFVCVVLVVYLGHGYFRPVKTGDNERPKY